MVAPAVKEIKKIVRKPLSLLERKVLDNGTIFYKVLNGGGYKYDIWLHENGRTTCQQAEDGESCPSTRSGRRCYHVQYALDLELLHEQQEAQKNIPAPKPELAYAPAVGGCYSFRAQVPAPAPIDREMPTNPVLYHDAPNANAHVCHGRHWNGNYCYYGNHYINA